MKKILFIVFMSLYFPTFAFDYSCFEHAGNITDVENKTLKVITDNTNNYYFQDGELLNTKTISEYEKKYYSFEIDGNSYQNYSHDFAQYDEYKELTIHFPNTLLKNTFSYSLSTNNSNYHFELSKDGKDWNKIEDDIVNYDIDYLKIIFDNKNLKNTSIYDISFYQNGDNIILVNSISKSDIKVYNNYVCDNDELTKWMAKSKKTIYFPTDTTTKTYTLQLQKNPIFEPSHLQEYINRDSDADGVVDVSDNCMYDYNPNQLDSTSDGVGDACSDKDSDGVLGKLDNCPTVNNGDQVDENKNGIGDVCEQDQDKDTIFDAIDNCINTSNPDQFDSDGDNIGDTCDNCSQNYNSDQKDIDNDKIGDACDKKDDRYIESNKNFFITILVIVAFVFLGGIILMIQKLKNMKK